MLEPRSLRANAVAGVPKEGGGPPAAPTPPKEPPTVVGGPAGVMLPPAHSEFPGATPLRGPPEGNRPAIFVLDAFSRVIYTSTCRFTGAVVTFHHALF